MMPAFAAPKAPSEVSNRRPWNILIVDDEDAVHNVTNLVLANVQHDEVGVNVIHAKSGREAMAILKDARDRVKAGDESASIPVAIVDVVMETEHAGLDLVRWIRQEFNDKLIRLIIRTGQPGQAPEDSVIANYEVNGYISKFDLTARAFVTLVKTCLRNYYQLSEYAHTERKLKRVISENLPDYPLED